MLTNVKLGIIIVTCKHVATTHMVLTHVNVATAGVETGMPAKVKRKYTCILLDIINILSVVHYNLTCDNLMIDLYCPSQDKPTAHIILRNTLKAIAVSLSQIPLVQDCFLT